MARKIAYLPEYAEQARKLCLLGAIDVEIADFFNVSLSTIWQWKGRHVEFAKALKLGKAEADRRVERSLYQRAIGYSHPDVHISNYQGEVTVTPITKHYPPDTMAAMYWLNNRKSEEWRNRHDISGRIKHDHKHESVSETDRWLEEVLSEGQTGEDKEPVSH